MSVKGWSCMLLAVGTAFFATFSVASAGESAEASISLPKTLSRIWLKTPEKKLTGDMIITDDGIEFDSRKRRVFLSYDAMDILTFGRVQGDIDTDWVVLRVVENGLYRRYAIRDGKRFGYGTRTGELYDLLRAVLRSKQAGQFRSDTGYEPFDLFDLQFSTEYPEGWEVVHRELIEAERGYYFGTAVFSPEPVSPDADSAPASAFVMHRREAEKDMTCRGIGKRGLETLGELLAELGHAVAAAPAWEDAPLGGCAGLRARVDGGRPAELHVAADGVTLVILELPSAESLRPEQREPFDHAAAAFKFAWGY